MRRILTACYFLCAILALAPYASAIIIETVPVGNAGNANDPATGNVYGGVNYTYRIAKTEVTNAQYAEFLNAKAKSDPLGLYFVSMNDDVRGGITQSGVSGSFTYATKPNMADKPVNYVDWYDAIRFANWMHNGQGAGNTEAGAYTIAGGTATPSNGLSITRSASAQWFLPTENEWYKAAYFQPSNQGGDSDNYWLYPTRSNSVPTLAAADSVGNISNPGANVANYISGADWNGQDGNVTTVGSAGPLSNSFYGTADQGGNVMEWNEKLVTGFSSGTQRGLRGGSWDFLDFGMAASNTASSLPTDQSVNHGFRLATFVIPEPSTVALAAIGAAALGCLALRRRQAS